jgi:hypothetical protein
MSDFIPSSDDLVKQLGLTLAELRKGPRTTLELRALNVAHPGGRIMSLRRLGFHITTCKRDKFAEYHLHSDEVAA